MKNKLGVKLYNFVCWNFLLYI